jgi:hypothetical protein
VTPPLQPNDTAKAPRPEPGEEPARRGGSLEPRTGDEMVDEASDESFPASDPPAWIPIASP